METYKQRNKMFVVMLYKTDDVVSMKTRWNPVVNAYQLEVNILRKGVPLVWDESKCLPLNYRMSFLSNVLELFASTPHCTESFVTFCTTLSIVSPFVSGGNQS